MDENRRPKPLGCVGCRPELTRTNSHAETSSPAQNCEDVLCSSDNWMLDNGSEWTDEKHNSYLHQLEASFVKRLYQSKRMLARYSEQSQRGMHISQKQLINSNKASEEVKFNLVWNGYWKRNSYARCEPLSSNVSVDSGTPLISEGVYNFPCTSMCCSVPPTAMPEFLKLSCEMKYGKGNIATSPEEYSPRKPPPNSLLSSTAEGTGQNFLDEDNEIPLNFESPAKRLKMACEDSSIQRSN